MNSVEILVPLGLFLLIGTIVFMVVYFRFRRQQDLQLTLRESLSSGQSLSPESIEQLVAAMNPAKSDLRRGMLWVAVALGAFVFSFVIHDDEVVGPLAGIAAIPFFVGVAYLILWRLRGDSD